MAYDSDHELLDEGRARLQNILGSEWSVVASPFEPDRPDLGNDAVWELRRHDSNSYEQTARVVVVAKTRLSPREARDLLSKSRSARYTSALIWIVLAPWLSSRTRQVLDEGGVGYIDTTGNVSLRTDRPTIVICTDGSNQSPMVDSRPRRTITGTRAAHLIRELIDFSEPRRASELAAATNLSEGYVSRLLDSLVDEALISRDSKTKIIERIDWQGLLRARADTYQLLKTNKVIPALARVGRRAVLNRIATPALSEDVAPPVLVTGSTAAEGVGVRETIDGALMLYVSPGPETVRQVSRELGVLRIDQAADADVLLLVPSIEAAPAIFRRSRRLDSGLPVVGMSQLALDCLSGPGRLPADGEAVIEWMADKKEEWRRPSPLIRPTI